MSRSYPRPLTTPAASRTPQRGTTRPFVSLLSDFGLRDPSAAIMKGVVLGVAADANVVDISHEVDKYQVRDGALLLWCAVPYLPVGVHVAVVDPGVGTERLPLAVRTARGDTLVGPDNGLLLPAAERLGGVSSVHVLESTEHRLPVVSSSFHGRDIFAPAAAHLALGVPIGALGPALEPGSLARLDWPAPSVGDGRLEASVIYVDTFGSLKLAAEGDHLRSAFDDPPPGTRLRVAWGHGRGLREVEAAWVETFGRVAPGEPLLYEDSYGRLCLAVNQGAASQALGIARDMPLRITRA
ncbi:MAG TPA: SAM-dependent chlorinase/fluorinase [Candidatus Limnocylindrales bacterium]|nr:SAM-dependent chlorinase/fluorinase [Candidatus Limnocylindrales bacterium]